MSSVGIRISKEMEASLNKLVELSKRDKSSLIKEALQEYLEDRHDYYLILDRLEQQRRQKKKTYSLDEIKKDLGINDDDA